MIMGNNNQLNHNGTEKILINQIDEIEIPTSSDAKTSVYITLIDKIFTSKNLCAYEIDSLNYQLIYSKITNNNDTISNITLLFTEEEKKAEITYLKKTDGSLIKNTVAIELKNYNLEEFIIALEKFLIHKVLN